MNPDAAGFSADLAELKALAHKAVSLAETLRTAQQQDWFEDDEWPDGDPLRTAVITYRRSLQAVMERLSTGADRLSAHLEATADCYRDTDMHAARTFERIALTGQDVERADGSAGS